LTNPVSLFIINYNYAMNGRGARSAFPREMPVGARHERTATLLSRERPAENGETLQSLSAPVLPDGRPDTAFTSGSNASKPYRIKDLHSFML